MVDSVRDGSATGPGPDPAQGSSDTRRVVVAGMLGTVIEYFDFLVFATVSGLVFGELFFPSEDPSVGTLLAISTFAVGYLVRPLGGIVFGHLGDRFGRRQVLFATLMVMGVATVLIGVLPTYAVLGPAAPVLLVVLRIAQGFGVGGEYGGAAVMVVEHAERSGRRGLLTSLVTCAGSAGFLLASGLLAVLTGSMSDEAFTSWGWRIPFLVSAVLLGVGFWVRFRLRESPVMREAVASRETVRVPLLRVLRHEPRQVLVALAAPSGLFVAYYIVLVFAVPYAARTSSVSSSRLLALLTASQVVYLVAIVAAGWVSDHVGRRIPMVVGAVGLAIWGFAFFPLLLSGSSPAVFAAFTVALLFLAAIYGPLASYLAELFSTGTRYSGLSFGYQISAAVAGGLSPVAATAMTGDGRSWLPVAGLIALGSAVTVAGVLSHHDTSRKDLRA